MPLFTISLDFRQGTYLAQVHARTPELAAQRWSRNLDASNIQGLGPSSKHQLIEGMEQEDAAAIDGLKNVWCLSASLRGGFALVHVFQTVPC